MKTKIDKNQFTNIFTVIEIIIYKINEVYVEIVHNTQKKGHYSRVEKESEVGIRKQMVNKSNTINTVITPRHIQ